MGSPTVHFAIVVALCLSMSLPQGLAQTRTTTPATDSVPVHARLNTLERQLYGLETTMASAISEMRQFVREQMRSMYLEVEQTSNDVKRQHERSKVYRGCEDALLHGRNTSGVYTIGPYLNNTTIDVYCEQTLDGGGWTVIQSRNNGTIDFNKNWNTYKGGFGYLTAEFWLGNEMIHMLTKNHDQQLKIELTSPEGNVTYANYEQFWIGDEASKYKLHISGYSGQNPPDGDCMSYHNGSKFSTKDQDNDPDYAHCATKYSGAWWYKHCHRSNLNGVYGSTAYGKGLSWDDVTGFKKSLKATRMMIKKKT